MPKSRSLLSRSLIKGILRCTLGILIPFLVPISPPLITVQLMSSPSTLSTLSLTFPSFIKTVLPSLSWLGKSLYDIDAIFSLPKTSLAVNVNFSPSCKVTEPFSNLPRRISGPLVSSKIATGAPRRERTFLIVSIVSL